MMAAADEPVVFDGWHRGSGDADGKGRGRRRLIAAGIAAVAVPTLWTAMAVGPGLIWEGTQVWEPCDAAAERLYGKAGEVRVLREDVHVDWFPPRWVCPLSNGDTVHP